MAVRALRIASFCAGYGGIDLAIGLAVPGARSILYVEREAYVAALLATRMAEGAMVAAPIWSDLGTFDGRPWRGLVDCVTAGLPCQPYSTAGKRLGHDDARAIWPEFIRIVGEMQPALVFLENVPPFTRFFRPIGERLCELGYRVEAGLFSAAEVGAPHLRERFFCLAYRDGGRLQGLTADGLWTRQPQLNPVFVGWLMSLPSGWLEITASTSCEPLVTASSFSQWRWRSRRWLAALASGRLYMSREEVSQQ